MKRPKVSVVVPVYNSEAYLPACIDTLLAQTLREMEFIFVCDGSPDGSLALLLQAQEKDARVRVIEFAQNRGVSAARNAGLEAAQGAFIGFCDGDDFVQPQMYQALYEAAMDAEADISFCRVFKDSESGSRDVPLGFEDGARFDAEAIRQTLIPAMLSPQRDSDELPLSGYTPRNLFRRETALAARFREDIRYAEDLLYIVSCLLHARAAVAVDKAYYHYRFHAGSVTKRYSPHVPASHERCNDALEALLCGYPSCAARMRIRRRKMAMTAVRNLCYPGTPYGFPQRVRRARAYMSRADVRALFEDVRPFDCPAQMGVKLFLMKHRMALTLCALFSFVFDRI